MNKFSYFRAKLFKIGRCNFRALWCIWSSWLDCSTSITSSVYRIWDVNLCSILCSPIHYFYGFCHCNSYHDVYWFRYHWRFVYLMKSIFVLLLCIFILAITFLYLFFFIRHIDNSSISIAVWFPWLCYYFLPILWFCSIGRIFWIGSNLWNFRLSK